MTAVAEEKIAAKNQQERNPSPLPPLDNRLILHEPDVQARVILPSLALRAHENFREFYGN
jgi:hypothetical protein